MNSDNLSNLARTITSPIDNKYIRSMLLILLLPSSSIFIPRVVPISSNILNYTITKALLTLTLSYLLTNDIYVSMVATVFIFVLSYIVQNYEGFETSDYVNLLVNEYNHDLDKTENKSKKVVRNKKKQEKFDFNIDNLRYLNYDDMKLAQIKQDINMDDFNTL
jgi:hypothetical protein